MYKLFFIIGLVFFLWGCSSNATPDKEIKHFEFNPENYIAYKTNEAIIIDGKLIETSWENAMWTNSFVDIEGDSKPKPTYNTQAKLLWNNEFLYIAAKLEEPHVWATLKQRDTVIFYDNDFEVFIDPNSDTHEYYELEVNAFGTEWDLLLTKPYRNNGRAIDHWSINGLQTGINVEGTLNNPTDIDSCWTVELAIPWDALKECAHSPTPPKHNNQWRMGFSRVQWQTEIINGKYNKVINPETNKPFHENNWVWSPQGVIAMHQPETWGIVQFSKRIVGTENDTFIEKEEYYAGWLLYQIHNELLNHKKDNNQYPDSYVPFSIEKDLTNFIWPPEYYKTKSGYELFLQSKNASYNLILNQEGKLIKSN